ncbi:unnamed protein product [Rangifer tarandus platyrhynchus]|uniref:Uncharacterized protein n=1 Tax=Rangifer tarandus platyrhynchus TaxID=3082113 RepID=A0ABN8XYZ9_RANTA|nr:unnamed protein product [Rangifer tarandus platyrhynchus]
MGGRLGGRWASARSGREVDWIGELGAGAVGREERVGAAAEAPPSPGTGHLAGQRAAAVVGACPRGRDSPRQVGGHARGAGLSPGDSGAGAPGRAGAEGVSCLEPGGVCVRVAVATAVPRLVTRAVQGSISCSGAGTVAQRQTGPDQVCSTPTLTPPCSLG